MDPHSCSFYRASVKTGLDRKAMDWALGGLRDGPTVVGAVEQLMVHILYFKKILPKTNLKPSEIYYIIIIYNIKLYK